MPTMGGGPVAPTASAPASASPAEPGTEKEKEIVLAVLPWPKEQCQPAIDALRREFPDLDIQHFYTHLDNGKTTVDNIPPELPAKASYIATLFWLPDSPRDIPKTKLIQFFSAGTNQVANHPIYTHSKIPLCSASGVHGPQIAEWVVMMDLVHAHQYTKLYDLQKERRWEQRAGMTVSDRVGKRVGVLGYGSIGRQVARVAKAMGMDVIAYTASPRSTPESKHDDGYIVPGTGDPDGSLPSAWYSGTSKDDLHEFLKQEIDLLVIGVPLTKYTTHLLSTPEFALLHKSNPRGTYIANIARGQILDQRALIHALETQQIRGAALDVADPEPLPEDDPLWRAPNVLITPHVSGASDAYAERAFQVLATNIRRQRGGGRLVNEVNRDRGY